MLARLILTFLLLVAVSFIALSQQTTSTSSKDSVDQENEMKFKIVDKSATFPGGMNKFYEYVNKHSTYPKEKKKKGNTAKIFIMFTINQDGSIDQESVSVYTSNEISRQSSSIECKECELEAIRLIKASPKWTPGESENKPVRQRMVVPIFFSGL